jgi:hypothetical protein
MNQYEKYKMIRRTNITGIRARRKEEKKKKEQVTNNAGVRI